MKSQLFAAALLTVLGCSSLEGCSTLQAIGGLNQPVGSISPDALAALNAAKKGLTAAHLLHEGAADAATVAARSGLLTGANATRAKVLLVKSEALLVAADGLVAAADAAGIEAKIAAATALIAEVEAMAGGK